MVQPLMLEKELPIAGEDDIVSTRRAAREMAKELGFGLIDQSRITTAVSELARNVVRYATDGRGDIVIRSISSSPDRVGIEIVVSDTGPGIADIEEALVPGFTSGPGLGLGLPGTRRLMDEMKIESALGRGTTVRVSKWRR